MQYLYIPKKFRSFSMKLLQMLIWSFMFMALKETEKKKKKKGWNLGTCFLFVWKMYEQTNKQVNLWETNKHKNWLFFNLLIPLNETEWIKQIYCPLTKRMQNDSTHFPHESFPKSHCQWLIHCPLAKLCIRWAPFPNTITTSLILQISVSIRIQCYFFPATYIYLHQLHS